MPISRSKDRTFNLIIQTKIVKTIIIRKIGFYALNFIGYLKNVLVTFTFGLITSEFYALPK